MGISHERTDLGSHSMAQERYSMDRLHPSHTPGRRSNTASLADQEMEVPRISLEQPPPYSYSAGEHGSTAVLSTTGFPPPTEEHLFQIQKLTPSGGSSGSGALPIQHQFICANPMHDQQYLLVGSGNALHSVDLTLPSDKQSIRTHIQGIGFKEIHCLEDIGLVVVIAGRNSRVRCYDYDSIKRLVSYGHSKEGLGRPVEGGKLGAVKNMIQLRVETAFQNSENQGTSGSPRSSPKASPGTQSTSNRILKGPSPLPAAPQPPSQQQQQRQSTNLDRSLLSPPLNNPGYGDLRGIHEDEDDVSSTPFPPSTTGIIPSSSSTPSSPLPPPTAPSAAAIKKHKQRPMSFGGLASFAHEHVMKGRNPPQASQQPPPPPPSQSTPTSPSTATPGGKSKRFSQMASYLSQAAVNTSAAAQMAIGQDLPSEEAIGWGWDFTKLKQTKDVLALDFHYTYSTVYMTVLSQKGIDIYCRPKTARGRKPPTSNTASSSSGNAAAGGAGSGPRASGTGGRPSGSETPGRTSTSTIGGMATSADNSGTDIYEWRQVKQLYHPEAPNFMTVVKNSQDVTDIILGKGSRACVINVESMTVNELSRHESGGGVIQGISKKLGFRHSPIWHSYEKIPFDVPAHVLYPEAVATMYDRGDSKEQYSGYTSEQQQRRTSVYVDSYSVGRRSHDDIIQRPADQQSIHQEQLEEQERTEAELAGKLPRSPLLELHKTHGPSSSVSSSSSSSSNLAGQAAQASSGSSSNRPSRNTRMVTSDEVLNNAFSHRTAFQLFLATCGSQSRIVNLHGEPQSPIVLEWGSLPPQKVEFLKTTYDIYVVGFEKTSIVVFSLLRARKIKEFSNKDLIQAAEAIPVQQPMARVATAPASNIAVTPSSSLPPASAAAPATSATTTATTTSPPTAPTTDTHPHPSTETSTSTSTFSTSSLSSSLASSVMSSSAIKYLGRDNLDDDSLGIFFSYQHPRNGVSICKLGIVPVIQDDLELVGYYP